MGVEGVVREWHPAEGWGVIDTEATPGGCWAHFSALRLPGAPVLAAGDRVEFTCDEAAQDGYRFVAVEVWRLGTEPVDHRIHLGPGSPAYRSHLRITFDD